MNFFKTFIFALFSNCACINFIEHREKSSSTAGFVLDIIVDFNSKFIDSRDIYILREHCKEFCDKVEDLHSEITKKIANFIPIVSPSGQETLTQTNIVKASFIIIITDVFSQVRTWRHKLSICWELIQIEIFLSFTSHCYWNIFHPQPSLVIGKSQQNAFS